MPRRQGVAQRDQVFHGCWPDAKAEARYEDWEARYQKACRDYATCELTATPGSQQIDPTVQLILKTHDETTLAESKLDLA